jgi:chromosomal replication initiation ATPase DnaA
LALELPHRPALGMEDFLVADCNAQAVRWIDRWPDWPGPVLFVFGPPGCGKSHLAHVWLGRSRAAIVEARSLDPAALGETPEEAPAIVVEDADPPLAAAAETALFHLCNLAAERRGHLLVTAELPPARAGFALPDLASRLGAATIVGIGAPDDALLGAVLVKLFRDRQLLVPAEAVTYMLKRIERSFAGARAAVSAIDRAALARRRAVSVSLVREALGGHEDAPS